MRELYDEIRSCWVSATPEEIVRQLWIKKMVSELGYPKELIAVEKELKTLPHLSSELVPDRRADIICFANKETIFPLLLMECKAEPLSQKAIEQVLGYNMYVQAPYIAVVNDREICFRYDLSCTRCVLNHLPSYAELLTYA
jgi:hypothetical protein